MERFTADPTASVPKACNSWGETMAAYRFFDNGSIDWRAIMAPHWEADRAAHGSAAGGAVPAGHDGIGLQRSGGIWPRAVELRSSARHVPAPDLRGHARARAARHCRRVDVGARRRKTRRRKRGGPKESLRWIEGYERIAEMAAHLPDTRLVYVADREADLMPLMLRAQELGTPADWLVRASAQPLPARWRKLWQHTVADAPVGEISFAMAARSGVKARMVRQQLWVRRVELPAGKGQDRRAPLASSRARSMRLLAPSRSNGAC